MPSTALNIPASTSRSNPSTTISGNTKRSHPRQYAPRHCVDSRRIAGLKELEHSRLQRYRAKIKSSIDGVCDWSMRQWEAYFKLSESQFRRLANAWVEKGFIVRTARTGSNYPCDTYLWSLPPLAKTGGGVINDGKKKELKLNTNTNTPEKPVQPTPPPATITPKFSYHRVKCEWRWKQNHPLQQRKFYEHNALLIRQNKVLRSIVRGKHNVRSGPDPMLGARKMPDGYYSGQPYETDADREYREKYQSRQNEYKMNTKLGVCVERRGTEDFREISGEAKCEANLRGAVGYAGNRDSQYESRRYRN